MEEINSILIYRSFHNAMKCMPDDERLLLHDAIYYYAFEDVEPDFTGHPWAQSVFEGLRPNIDSRNASVINGKKGADEKKRRGLEKSSEGGLKKSPKGGNEKSPSKAEAEAEAEAEAKAEVKAEAKAKAEAEENTLFEANASCFDPEADVEAVPLNDGTEWRPTQTELEEYERLYPSVDVKREFAKMRGWSFSNPSKRKTKKGVKSFVNSWLSREQDRGKGRESPINKYDATDIWAATGG